MSDFFRIGATLSKRQHKYCSFKRLVKWKGKHSFYLLYRRLLFRAKLFDTVKKKVGKFNAFYEAFKQENEFDRKLNSSLFLDTDHNVAGVALKCGSPCITQNQVMIYHADYERKIHTGKSDSEIQIVQPYHRIIRI